MLTAFGNLVSRWSNDGKPWTNVYGLARTLMALGTMLTLIANDIPDLFPRVAGMPEPPICQGGMSAGMFCLFPKTQLEIARIVCILLLAVVATGYRPRIFGLVHWFVTVSFQMGASSLDGGDQVSTCLTLLLLPVTLTDTRKWHWDELKEDPNDKWLEAKRFFAKTSLWLCRFQMAGIYFHASAGKYATTEWNNGTALYYWFSHPLYGVSDWARPILMPILTHSTVALMTWGTVVAEFVLVGGLFTAKKYWKYLLVLGLSLHFGIALLQGLVSFCFAMSAGLILYLRPTEDVFAFTRTKRVRRLLTGIVLKMGTSKASSEIGDLS